MKTTDIGKAPCTVLAFAAAANVSVLEANIIVCAAGRKKGRKFHSFKLIQHALRNGFPVIKTQIPYRQSIKQFIKENPIGRFYLRKNGHAFAVVDGELIDKTKMSERCKIVEGWEFYPCS